MRLFVAGGTGALGVRIVRLLAQGGHDVTATARTEAGLHGLDGPRRRGAAADAPALDRRQSRPRGDLDVPPAFAARLLRSHAGGYGLETDGAETPAPGGF